MKSARRSTPFCMAQLALKDELPAQQRERVEQIRRASRHLLGILTDVLDFRRSTAATRSWEHKPFSLSSIAGTSGPICSAPGADQIAAAARRMWTTTLPEHCVDAQRLADFLINYVHNAIGSPTRARWWCPRAGSARRAPPVAWAEVQDTGIGTTAQQMEGLIWNPSARPTAPSPAVLAAPAWAGDCPPAGAGHGERRRAQRTGPWQHLLVHRAPATRPAEDRAHEGPEQPLSPRPRGQTAGLRVLVVTTTR